MSEILTEEMISTVAKALYENSGWNTWEKDEQEPWRSRAKIALLAALPLIVEKIAQRVEGWESAAAAAGDLRDLIRSLVTNKGE